MNTPTEIKTSVSIHAPARGATWRQRNSAAGFLVSIHAPARGATDVQGCTCITQQVSIHAPARGATVRRHNRHVLIYVSIHAPARGATPGLSTIISSEKFQSTPPHGGRPQECFSSSWLYEFQSTPPHGGRLNGYCNINRV